MSEGETGRTGKSAKATSRTSPPARSRDRTERFEPTLGERVGNRSLGQLLDRSSRFGANDEASDERLADEGARTALASPVGSSPVAADRLPRLVHATLPDSLPRHARRVADGRGESLPPSLETQLSAGLGTDFGGARVHRDAEAARSAAALGAQAYAMGRHVVFAHGRYAPHTDAGRALIAHELAHVAQQRGSTPRIQRKPEAGPKIPLLEVSADDFDGAALNFAAILANNPRFQKARIVVVNGPNIRVYDEKGKAVEKKFFHLNAPVFLPTGVFGRFGQGAALRAVGIGPGGGWVAAGAVVLDRTIDFAKDIDDQEGFTKAITGFPTFYVSPTSTAVPPEADRPAPVPIENLPEFMEFEGKTKSNLPAWPSETMPLTPQIATVNSTGTFRCTVHKDQGTNTIDRVTNLMQPTAFRWEVLKLDEKLHVTGKKRTSGWDSAKEGFSRRARNIEDDRQAMIGDRKKQGGVKTALKSAVAEPVSNTRMALAMTGQAVMTVINAITGGPSQLTTEDIIDVPFKEQGDYFVRCLATQIVPKDAKWRRATSVSGAMVSVYDIEDVARNALPDASEQKARADEQIGSVEARLQKLDEELTKPGVDRVLNRSLHGFVALEIDYRKELGRAGTNPYDRNVAEMGWVRARLEYLDSDAYPSGIKYADARILIKGPLKKREAELAAELKRMEGKLKERDYAITTIGYMPAVLVDELTGATTPLNFAVGERQFIAADDFQVVIADVTGSKGRTFDGIADGSQGAGRHDAWLEALTDLRRNLNRGRGYLSYEVPKPYDAWKSELPNPMKLEMSAGAQIKEMVDDTAHVLTLAAIMAAPFTGGASLGILAVLAPIQAASSLYNIVNRAAYGDLELDTEAVFDLINIATLGLGKISTAGKFATKTVQMVATSSRVAIRLLTYGQFVLMTYETLEVLMQTGDPNDDPRELRRKKLQKLLGFLEAASIPISEKLFHEAGGTGSKAGDANVRQRNAEAFETPTEVIGRRPAKPTVHEGEFVDTVEPKAKAKDGEVAPRETGAPGEPVSPAKPTADRKAGGDPAATHGVEGPATAAGDAMRPPAFKPAEAQLKGVPKSLKGKVAVVEGMGRDARVVYKRGANGLISDVQIQMGRDASAADVMRHAEVANTILKYAGVGGRVRRLAGRFAELFSSASRPDIGSRAWESRLEMDKLDALMGDRHAELAKIAELPPEQRDASRQAELLDDLDVMETKYEEHERVYNAIEMGTEQGRGYVAVEGLSEGERVRTERGFPKARKGYQWRFRKGRLEYRVIERGRPKMVYDEQSGKFVEDKGGSQSEPFEAGTTRSEAFDQLGGFDEKSSFGAFVKVLLERGVIGSRRDVVRAMGEPGNRMPETVRGGVKEGLKVELVKDIVDPARLKKTAKYKEVLAATRDAKQARRAAAMEELIEVSGKLDASDRGSVGEQVYDALFGKAPRLDVSPEQLAVARGVKPETIEQGRTVDRMEGDTAREIKNVSSRLGPRERGQIDDMLALEGFEVQPSRGKPRILAEIVVTFLDPVGGQANASLALDFLNDNPNKTLTFEFHTRSGKVISVNHENRSILEKPGFGQRLGLPLPTP